MEDAFIIQGGAKLSGSVEISGSKNIAIKVLIAALMFEGEVVLENVPSIGDVDEIGHLIQLLGGSVDRIGSHALKLNADSLHSHEVDLLHGSKIRTSFMFFAPLLHKLRKAHIPNPGGCRLGARSIDRIVTGLNHLGASVEYDSETGYYNARLDGTPNGMYRFAKPTHTGTELLIMFAAIGSSRVRLENAAMEPEIDELIRFLNEAGARIVRSGDVIEIEGVSKLAQTKPYRIAADRNEAVTFATLAIAGRGSLTLKGIVESDFTSFVEAIRQTGSSVRETSEGIVFEHTGVIRPVSIETQPHPGFMTDWQPNWAVLMTQAAGTSTIHERIFENRFAYVEELQRLGAEIEHYQPIVTDPVSFYHFAYDSNDIYLQAIRITGGATLHGGALEVHDLRAGASLLVAALIAEGESVITNITTLDRGYEAIEQKITKLGGKVKRV